MDVGETSGADSQPVPLRVHSLLLALAGRIDDSVLRSAHELVARADVDEAAELTAGTLVAGRIPVRAAERRELASVLELSQCDTSLVDELVIDDLGPSPTHRFSGGAGEYGPPEAGVSRAIERVTRVLPDVRTVHAVWRLTPAGAIPGPLPTRVVLIEVGPDANPPTVAYRIEVALDRMGIAAVVEVMSPESGRSRYHEWALAVARPVEGAASHGMVETAPSHGRQVDTSSSAPQAPDALRSGPTRAQRRNPGSAPTETAMPFVTGTYSEQWAAAEVDVSAEQAAEWQPQQPPDAEPERQRRSIESGGSAVDTGPEPDSAVEPLALPGSPDPWRSAFIEPNENDDDATGGQQEERVASTTEMTPAEMAQLRQALAEDPEKGRQIAASVRPGEVVEIPELDLDDPQLSERDRELLRELHAELAARERADAGWHGVNGSQGN